MKKWYYWVVFVSCCFLTAGSIGICINSVGIFYTPVSEALGVGRGAFAMHTTISNVVVGLCSPLVVNLFLRYNTKLLLAAGVLLSVVSTLLMGFSTGLVSFYVLGVVRGIGCALFSNVPVTMIIGNWFEKRHDLVVGIVFCFSGLGGVLFNSLFSVLIEAYGWEVTYMFVALVMLVVSLPAALLLYYRPVQVGLQPFGRKAEEASPLPEAGAPAALPQELPEAKPPVSIFSSSFILVSVFSVLAVFVTGFGQHIPGYADHAGLGASLGATMLSAAMVGNIVFKLLIGVLSDKFGPVKASAVMIAVNIVSLGMFSFLGADSYIALFIAASLLFGTMYSIGAVGIPLLTRYVFGTESYAAIYGYISLLCNISGAVALSVIGYVYDFLGAYTVATVGCMVFGVINLGLLWVIQRKKKRV